MIDGLDARKGLCNRPVYLAIETCIEEDRGHPDLCSKCHMIMNWKLVRGRAKEYLDVL